MEDLSQEEIKKQLQDMAEKLNKVYYELAIQKRSLSMLAHLYSSFRSLRDKERLLQRDIPDVIKQIQMVEVAIYYWERINFRAIRELLFDRMLELMKKRVEINLNKREKLSWIITFHCNYKK